MPDNVAKIIIDAVADGVLRTAEAVKKKFTEVGEQGSKAGESMVAGLGKSLLTAAALLKVLNGVAEAYNRAAADAAKVSKEAGGRQLGAEIAGQRLGLNAGQTASILNASGSRSLDERSAFLAALASGKGPGGRKIDAATAIEASRIFEEGTVDQGELLETISKRGRGGLQALGAESRRRYDALSPEARLELGLRGYETESSQRVAATSGAFGHQERLRLSNEEALRAEHPAAYGVVDAVRYAGGDKMVEAGSRYTGSSEETLKQIAENTRPRLNSTGTNGNGP